nr:ankyrin repeat-containing protein ITN1-like [Coffea arabica]
MTNVDGNTALHEAVKNNFYEVAKLLVQQDPEFRYRPNHAMETPLYLAVEKGYRDFAVLILTTSKSPAYLGPGHKTALHAAAIWNLPVSLTKYLLIAELVDKFGWTALHYAAKLNHPAKLNHEDVVKLLLSAKRSTAYVAARNDDSRTALHIAVIHGHVAVVQELLSIAQIVGRNILTDILIKDELEQAGGTRGYRNVATVKKNLRVSNPDEVKRVEKLAANYSIVATLIATVTFAAGFTVPGGNYSDGPHKGMAVLSKKAAFITFVISDSLAMFASIGAVLGLTRIKRVMLFVLPPPHNYYPDVLLAERLAFFRFPRLRLAEFLGYALQE